MANKGARSVSYYHQVANVLRSCIVSSDSDIPVRLPSERELAETHRVARGTIRQALALLVDEGLIEQGHGRGTTTIPKGIQAWRKLHKSQVIQVISWYQTLTEAPTDYYGQIYQGILVRSEECGYRVRLKKMLGHFPPMNERFVPEDPEQVTGVITTSITDERFVSMHANAKYPVVCTDYWPAQPLADGVVIDCFGDGQLAADFLLGLGHRTFFYLGNTHIDRQGKVHRESDAELAEAGFCRALREAGADLPATHVRFVRFGQIEQIPEWLLALRPRPTAGLVFSDHAMAPLVEGLRRRGVYCPQDISLMTRTTVNDTAQYASMCSNPYRLGSIAVDLLLERTAGTRREGMRVAIASTLRHGPTVRSL